MVQFRHIEWALNLCRSLKILKKVMVCFVILKKCQGHNHKINSIDIIIENKSRALKARVKIYRFLKK